MARYGYRARQFWQALRSRPSAADLELARRILNPAELDLFLQMQACEQVHAVQVLRKIQATGPQGTEPPHELAEAALLHDVGKIRFPLRIWERVTIVLAAALFPSRTASWGQARPAGWRRPFAVAEQHPAWGARLVAEAGASNLVCWLIEHHQDGCAAGAADAPMQMLLQLQRADDQS